MNRDSESPTATAPAAARANDREPGTTRLAAWSIPLGALLLIAAIGYAAGDIGQDRPTAIEKAVATASSLRSTVSAELDAPCDDVHVSGRIATVDCFGGRDQKRASIAVWADETEAEQIFRRPVEVAAADRSASALFVRGARWEIALYTVPIKERARDLAQTTGGRVVRPGVLDLPE